MITPKGPAYSGGQISLINIGDITEKQPAQLPIISLPTIKLPKYYSSETAIPKTKTILIIRRAFHLPIEAIFPPVKAPIAAPRGAAVPIKEFARSLFSQPSYTGIRVVRKL